MFSAQLQAFQRLWPFRNQSLWEKYEPIWLVLISLAIVIIISVGLKSAISSHLIASETLYISPTSYTLYEDAGFFIEKTATPANAQTLESPISRCNLP